MGFLRVDSIWYSGSMNQAPLDKFSAIWVSHSSIGDFIKCPRAYYLNHIYKNPKTGKKISLMSPPYALGQAVHEVVESLSTIPTDQRFKESLIVKFERVWEKYTGKKGGFFDQSAEDRYRERGKAMLKRVVDNPGPIAKLAVKINIDLPNFWLSESDNLILCGKIDWLEYLSDTDSVRIIDFKTSRTEESDSSLQLPIYYLLAKNCQQREVVGVSYWYLEFSDQLEDKPLPNYDEAYSSILKHAKDIKLARQLNRFKCPNGDEGCTVCIPLEEIVKGKAELINTKGKKEIYVLNNTLTIKEAESVIL